MVKKRKAPTATTTAATPPSAKKQQKSQEPEEKQPVVEEKLPVPEPEPEQPDLELEEVEEEVEEEIEGSEEEEVEEEEEEVEGEEEAEAEAEDEDEDPIATLIEPFTKEQLASIVREAAEKHSDVANRVRKLADQDTVHRKIFIHGLGWDTTTETLIAAFKGYGEIEDCKAVTDKNTGKSKGYGFILFKTRAGARKALKEPQKTVSGRTASCQLAALGPVSGNTGGGGSGGGNTGGFSGMSSYQTEYTQRKIYISNVGPELDPGKLQKYFAKYGDIEEGPLGIDKSTGKFKGFCLFVYKTVESARKALEEPHKTYEGLTLHCQRAIDGPKPGKGGGNSGGHGSGSGSGSYHGHGRGGGYVRGENPIVGPSVSGPGLGLGGAGLNPALGQALTTLLASQGAGLGLHNLLGTLGGGGSMGGGGGYGGPGAIGPGGIGLGGYGSGAGGYPSSQLGQGGGVGRSHQHGYNGTPYGGHH